MRPVEEMYHVQPGFRLCISTSSALARRNRSGGRILLVPRFAYQTGFVLLASIPSYAIGLG
jgi:hypothetical protein